MRSHLLPFALVAIAMTHAQETGRTLPDFRLEDPAGAVHTRADLARGGLVLVVTAPIHKNERAQRGWDDHLGRERPQGTTAKLAFLEDMQQSWFQRVALAAMRHEYVAGNEPVLLLDHDGATRRALQVDVGLTVVLVFDATGALRATERGAPSAEAARRLWASLAL
jgi:hypothetical protein